VRRIRIEVRHARRKAARAGVATLVGSTVLAAAIGVLAAGGGASTAQSGTSPTWKIDHMPRVKGALSDVSCTSPTACMAVGYAPAADGGEVTLAEDWRGSVWSVVTTPNPTGATRSSLNGVACTSASACVAVGASYNNEDIEATLAELWNGTTWTLQTTPSLPGTDESALNGVSCASSTLCTAVGSSYPSAGAEATLAEVWNGVAWTVATTPNPTSANGSALNGVSCTSASACTAAGDYFDSSGTEESLAEVWRNSTWAVQSTPNPPGAYESSLEGLSCTSPSHCTAVGDYYVTKEDDVTLAESWNGSAWSVDGSNVPPGKRSSLGAVSCTSAVRCTAVGYSVNQAFFQVTLVEVWTGSNWAVQASNGPSGNVNAGFDAVSCQSSMSCTAVGYYYDSSNTQLSLVETER
jgi:hypothetical protein